MTLIPSYLPSSLLLDTALEARGLSNCTAVNNLSLAFDNVIGFDGNIRDIVVVPEAFGSNLEGSALDAEAKQVNEINVKSDLCDISDYAFVKPVRSEYSLSEFSSSSVEEASLAQEKKVQDVSKYVISAAKDPEFAQKLHAVLLESGASPPADLFVDMSPSILREKRLIEVVQPTRQETLCYGDSYNCDMPDHSADYVTRQCLQLGPNLPCFPRPNAESVLAVTESDKMTTNGGAGVLLFSEFSL